MEKLHKVLKGLIFVESGACVGRVLVKYLHYVGHPIQNLVNSAPWYIDIVVILMVITVLVTTIVYFVIGYIMKKHNQEKPEDAESD